MLLKASELYSPGRLYHAVMDDPAQSAAHSVSSNPNRFQRVIDAAPFLGSQDRSRRFQRRHSSFPTHPLRLPGRPHRHKRQATPIRTNPSASKAQKKSRSSEALRGYSISSARHSGSTSRLLKEDVKRLFRVPAGWRSEGRTVVS